MSKRNIEYSETDSTVPEQVMPYTKRTKATVRRKTRTTRYGKRQNRTATKSNTRRGTTSSKSPYSYSIVPKPGPELKHKIFSDHGKAGSYQLFGTGATGLTQSSPFSLQTLNSLARGLSIQDRVGDVVTWCRFQMNVLVKFQTSVVKQTKVRMFVVRMLRPMGVHVTAGQFFNIMYGNPEPTMIMLPNINNVTQEQFYEILAVKEVQVTNPSDSTTEEAVLSVDIKRSMRTEYKLDNQGTVLDINMGELTVYFQTDNDVALGIKLTGEAILQFYDY